MRIAILLGGMLAVGMPATLAAADLQRYQGDARDGQGRLLYREIHYLQQQGSAPQRLVLYRCPDGKAFARKTVSGGGATPNFAFIDGRDGYEEGVQGSGGQRQVYWRESKKAAIQRKPVKGGGARVFDAGFDAYAREQWDSLIKGKSVSADFLIPSRLRSLGLSLQGAREGAMLKLQMRPTAWYGFAIPPIRLTYRLSDQRLLQFAGISTIRDGRGRNRSVTIDFPSGPANQVDAAEWTKANQVALDGRCAL